MPTPQELLSEIDRHSGVCYLVDFPVGSFLEPRFRSVTSGVLSYDRLAERYRVMVHSPLDTSDLGHMVYVDDLEKFAPGSFDKFKIQAPPVLD